RGAGSVRARARPRRAVRRDRHHPRPARAGDPACPRARRAGAHDLRHLPGAVGGPAPGPGYRGDRAQAGHRARRLARRASRAASAAAPPAPLPGGAAGRLRHQRRRPAYGDEPGLHRPARAACGHRPGAARAVHPRPRRAHRYLRRARRGRVPGQRPAGPGAGRIPVRRASRRASTWHRRRATGMTAAGLAATQQAIEQAWERRAALSAEEVQALRPAVEQAMQGLESGELRVAEPKPGGGWQVNEWLKKAVLLYFRVNDMAVVDAQPAPFWDKVEARFAGFDAERCRAMGVRVVPGAVARRGTYFGRDVVLMPSFVNIGAHVGEGTMVDTWATVGSCAQIGRHVHLSGGAGIGGVLEPLQASPTIIEDHCFIGARSEVVEGVVV